MMTKIKQRVIVILLVIAITASAIITIGLNTTTSARADSGYMDVPQITVLTHGLSSRASNWSNANGTGSGGFVQDTDSLLYKLSVKAGGAYIYRAETSSNSGQNPSYTLYDGYTTTTSNTANSCNCITDVSKHIIIVFDSQDSDGSNDTIYSEFKHMLNDVIARVTSLNQGQKKPKVNLIGHSRGGITNLQYTLDYPEYVDSLISIGTPYFGSPVAGAAGPLLFGTSAGLTDINNEIAYNGYYNRWTTGYESKYKDINSIAIGATTTIEYQRAVLTSLGGAYSAALNELLFYFGNDFTAFIAAVAGGTKYEELVASYPALGMFTKEEFTDLLWLIYYEVGYGRWYGDILVPVDSQQGLYEDKNYNFTKYVKEFSNSNSSLYPKLATNQVAVIHNLETYDPDIHNYILENIIMKNGDILNNEISMVGKYGFTNDQGVEQISKWYIKIRNIYSETRIYAYNSKLCFLDDAKNWTGLTDIVAFRLNAGETRIVEIVPNGTALSIAVSSTKGSTRYVRYVDNPLNTYILYYNMPYLSSTTSYRSYTENGMKVSIAGKNGGTWLIELTNNTGSGRTFYYNRKMCFDGDAQNWSGLSDVSTIYLSSGETTWAPLEISENGTATAIAISYNVGIERHIFYANNLNVSGTMTSYSNSKPTTYTQHGMKVCIVSKSGSTWKIQLTNNTGSTRTFEYNKKMCFDGDAQNWNGLADVSSITLSNGTSTQLSISENGFATAIAISYTSGNYRYVFWANNLDAATSKMSTYSNTINMTEPEDPECVAEGTLITLADGTQKAVEDLTGDELLLVWDMETGTYGAAPIMFVDSDLIGHYEVIELSFSDGTTVEVISEHGFWDVDLNEYVYLDENADDYIGHKFVKQNGDGYTEVTLTDVEISVEVTRAYSPVTYGHLCYYVNGMLSMPGGISGLFNIFDIDAETMSIDEEAYAADIAEYGVYTYEEFAETFPVSEEVFEAFNGKYLKVAIGKGQLTEERIGELIERYSEFF